MMNPEQILAVKELLRRKKAFGSLAAFSKEHLKVVPALHHQMICYEIDNLLRDEYDDLVITTPPGSAKSTYTSIGLPAYFIGNNPDKVILTASHGFDLAERWGKKVKHIVASEEFKKGSGVELSTDSRAAYQWSTTQGGEFFAVGVGGAVLGRRADLCVIDDPISGWEQANSITQLKKIHAWYETDLISRLKPRGKIVVICQRLARNDLAGYIMDRHKAKGTRRLKVLKIEMECTDTMTDPLMRSVGDRLWPEWYTAEMVADYKGDDFIWKTMYQQNPPADDGSWASTDDIQFRPSPAITPTTIFYGASDIALSVNSGDYTVHMIIAVDSKGDWDIIECNRSRVDPEQSSSDLVALCKTYHPLEWLIDDDNASKVFMHLVSTKARSKRVPVNWKPIPMRGQDKETRAAAVRGQFKRRKIYMPADAPFAKWLVNEIIVFPNGTGEGIDDGVDTLSLFGRRLAVISIPSIIEPPVPRKSIQEMCLEDLWDTAPRQFSNRRL